MRQDRFSLPEGMLIVQYPKEPMSRGSLNIAQEWLALIARKFARVVAKDDSSILDLTLVGLKHTPMQTLYEEDRKRYLEKEDL